MPHPLYIAFVWHQHQPLYKSPLTGEYRMPWVRLHGTKDYLDLLLHLTRYPQFHHTINLVPSLLVQIEDYAQGRAMDPYLQVSLKPAAALSEWERNFVVTSFFDAHHRTMIDPYPGYRRLYEQQQTKGRAWCLEHWSVQDFEDLLMWHNLTWLDPLFHDRPQVQEWWERGGNFTLADRQALWHIQREILAQIIPEHRRWQEAGVIELTTSPYSHPILPLLWDTETARVAVPDLPLPQRFQWPQDVLWQLQRGWECYQQYFGCAPQGLWPSEQSVSPHILEPIARQGFRWLCSDEGVLAASLRQPLERDTHGQVVHADVLYRPYKIQTPAGELAIVFRDHRLSDLIGFSYSHLPAETAVADLVTRLGLIYERAQAETTPTDPWLVTIALDGENCWEYYPGDGGEFLQRLFHTLSQDDRFRGVTVGEFLREFPPRVTLDYLHSGSWIEASFTTWIGDPVKNRAWEWLGRARLAVAQAENPAPMVWEALLAAEGSDWFWWFGAGHSSRLDPVFDALFREHLQAIYLGLGQTPPPELNYPLEPQHFQGDYPPEGLIQPVIDGRGDEQDWSRAGLVRVGAARATMHQSHPVQTIRYGTDHLHFYLRVDFCQGFIPGKEGFSSLHLVWFYPGQVGHTSPIPLAEVPDVAPCNYRFRHHLGILLRERFCWLSRAEAGDSWCPQPTRTRMALDSCLEVAVPWAELQVAPNWSVSLLLVLAETGRFRGYLPEQGLLNFLIP